MNCMLNSLMAIIYKITSPTGKIYVGATVRTLSLRKAEHKFYSKNSYRNNLLYEDMKNLGFDNFKFEEIEQCQDELRFARESFWINKIGSFNNGYNKSLGGKGPRGMKPTDEMRSAKSLMSKKMWANPKLRKKIMAAKMPSLQDSAMQSVKGKLGAAARMMTFPLYDVYDNGKYIGEFRNAVSLAKILNVNPTTARRYLDGKIGRKRFTLVRKDG